MPSAVGKWIFHKNITASQLSQFENVWNVKFRWYFGDYSGDWSEEELYLEITNGSIAYYPNSNYVYNISDGWLTTEGIYRLIDVTDDYEGEYIYDMLSSLATKINFLDITHKDLVFNSSLVNSEYTDDISLTITTSFISNNRSFSDIYFDLYHNTIYAMAYGNTSVYSNNGTWSDEGYKNIVFDTIPILDTGYSDLDDTLTFIALINLNTTIRELPVHKLGWKLIS